MPPLSRLVGHALCLITLVSAAPLAYGQQYPNRPLRLVTSGLGGGGDFTARVVATGIAPGLGQQVVVDNRAAGGTAGVISSQAAPDGYTLLVSGGSLWIGTLLDKTPYDALKDFAPISLLNRQPNVLVINPTLPVNSVKDLIALAKSKPGQLNYSSGSLGAASHLAAELFKSMAGVNIVRIPYKSVALRMTGLLTNEVQMEFSTPSGLAQFIKAGKLKALAVTSAQPSPLVPGLPTVAASGLPGYESTAVYGFFAPAKTPAAIIKRLNQEVVPVLQREDVKEKFLAAGIEAVGSTPQELADVMKSEMAKLGKVIREAGIRAE